MTRTEAMGVCLALSQRMAQCPCNEAGVPLCPYCASLLSIVAAALDFGDAP